jgi:hypothetical protein
MARVPRALLAVLLGGAGLGGIAYAATYGELAEMRGQAIPGWGAMPPAAAGGYGARPAVPAYPGYSGGPQMMPGYGMTGGTPGAGTRQRWPTATPYLPTGGNGLPSGRQIQWTYGQVNASGDPFNVYGLSTPHMFVPWSTPLSGWANAQSWDWWRARAGDAGPSLPLW